MRMAPNMRKGGDVATGTTQRRLGAVSELDVSGVLGNGIAMTRSLGIAGFLIFVAAFSAAVWVYSFTLSLRQLEQRGQSDLLLATDSLTNTLAGYRQLTVSLADDPRVQYHLGATYAALGNIDDALAQFQKVVEMPGNEAIIETVTAEIARLTGLTTNATQEEETGN